MIYNKSLYLFLLNLIIGYLVANWSNFIESCDVNHKIVWFKKIQITNKHISKEQNVL